MIDRSTGAVQSCSVQCPLCKRRPARRECPALGHQICAVCCGTKRLTEIKCPDDCGYLSASRQHPAAVVQRRQERDVAILSPTLNGLNDRQFRLLLLMASVIVRHVPEDFQTLLDADIAEAAGALASTLETASRGVIYEHRAGTRPALRLAEDLRSFLAEVSRSGLAAPGQQETATADNTREIVAPGLNHDVALALRRIERGARDTAPAAGDSKTAYRELLGRILNARPGEPSAAPASRGGSLILP